MSNLIEFPGPQQSKGLTLWDYEYRPPKGSDLDELTDYVETQLTVTVLFIDQSEFSQSYLRDNDWIEALAVVVEVDREIQDHFQICQVPTFLYFWKGEEVGHKVGTISKDEALYWHQVYSFFPRAITKRDGK